MGGNHRHTGLKTTGLWCRTGPVCLPLSYLFSFPVRQCFFQLVGLEYWSLCCPNGRSVPASLNKQANTFTQHNLMGAGGGPVSGLNSRTGEIQSASRPPCHTDQTHHTAQTIWRDYTVATAVSGAVRCWLTEFGPTVVETAVQSRDKTGFRWDD